MMSEEEKKVGVQKPLPGLSAEQLASLRERRALIPKLKGMSILGKKLGVDTTELDAIITPAQNVMDLLLDRYDPERKK